MYYWLLITLCFQFLKIAFSSSCSHPGLFANPRDATCRTFIQCFSSITGFKEKISYCPDNKLFDSLLELCSEDYNCAKNERNNTFQCKTQGRFLDENEKNCRSYKACYTLKNGQFLQMTYNCPKNTSFDSKLQYCRKDVKCPITEEPTLTISKMTNHSFKCNSHGKFPIEEDLTCTYYYYCIFLPGKGYINRIYKCNGGENFDPSAQKCSETYDCTITTKKESSTANDGRGSSKICKANGKFLKEDDSSCSQYFLCVSLPNGKFAELLYKCDEGQFFDSVSKQCKEGIGCMKKSSTPDVRTSSSITESSKTFDDCSSEFEIQPFQCKSTGRYPNYGDSSCGTYFLCVSNRKNAFLQYTFKCSNGSSFDPSTSLCAKDYKCTCNKTAASSEVTTEMGEVICEKEGRIKDSSDVTCKTYFFCASKGDGSFAKRRFSCRESELFDPSLQICSNEYRC